MAILLSSAATAQPSPAGLSAIFEPDARLERVATGLKFAEGPVWDGARLLVSDVQGDAIYEVAANGKFRAVRKGTHWANGHTWDRSGALIAAEHASGEVTRQVTGGPVQTLAARHNGKRLNSPNDVVVRSDGQIFFTDPPFGLKPPYGPAERTAEIAYSGVYRIDSSNGAVVLLTKDLQYPTGSPSRPTSATCT